MTFRVRDIVRDLLSEEISVVKKVEETYVPTLYLLQSNAGNLYWMSEDDLEIYDDSKNKDTE